MRAPRLARTFNYKAATQPCPARLAKTDTRLTPDLANARFAQTGGSLSPVFTVMLGRAKGETAKPKTHKSNLESNTVVKFTHPVP